LASKFVAESLKRLVDELGSIIMDDPSRHPKVVYYMMIDDFDHVRHFYFFQGDGFPIWRSNRLSPRWTNDLWMLEGWWVWCRPFPISL